MATGHGSGKKLVYEFADLKDKRDARENKASPRGGPKWGSTTTPTHFNIRQTLGGSPRGAVPQPQSAVHPREAVRGSAADGNKAHNPAPRKAAPTMQAQTFECDVCAEEHPFSVAIACTASFRHTYCQDCVREQAKHAIGDSKPRVSCMAPKCKGEYPILQLRKILDAKSVEALERTLTKQTLDMAQLENLVKCPFCDYAMELPPNWKYRVLMCQNRDGGCGKMSCRQCQREAHWGKPCSAMASKDPKVLVAEAMTEAVIRKCNRCGVPFMKEVGCNYMTCPVPTCANHQCYVCFQDVRDKDHHYGARKCPLFDNTSGRHDQEAIQAEKRILAELKKKNPNIMEEDLKIKVSAAVKADELAKIHADEHPENALGFFIEGEEDMFGPDMMAGPDFMGGPAFGALPGRPFAGGFHSGLDPRLNMGMAQLNLGPAGHPGDQFRLDAAARRLANPLPRANANPQRRVRAGPAVAGPQQLDGQNRNNARIANQDQHMLAQDEELARRLQREEQEQIHADGAFEEQELIDDADGYEYGRLEEEDDYNFSEDAYGAYGYGRGRARPYGYGAEPRGLPRRYGYGAGLARRLRPRSYGPYGYPY